MSKVRIDHLQVWRDKKTGQTQIRFRKRGMKSVRLPGPIGSDAFWDAYRLADAQKVAAGAALRSKAGSVSAALAAYYGSRMWTDAIGDGTRAMRRPILERFRKAYGEFPLSRLNQGFVETYLDTLKPHAARNHFKALRGFLQHAKHDVTQGIKLVKAKSKKHHSWLPEEMAQFEAAHPIGTKARLCFALAKFTGAATSDIAHMGEQHIRDGEIGIARTKTSVGATITVRPELRAIIDATPSGHLTFLVTRTGRPFRAGDLSEQFRAWCDEAGLPTRCVIHGLRHAMGDRLAEHGVSSLGIASVLGHASGRMAEHYTKGAERRKMARLAMTHFDTPEERELSNQQPVLTIQKAKALKLKAKI